MRQFDIKDTSIAGVKHIVRNRIGDQRGWFERVFCTETFAEIGWKQPINQINRTYTKSSGTVRGMHYQKPPYAEAKFVSCMSGKVLDVVVDLRENSETFLQYLAVELSAENNESLLIPEGVAHGFQTLSEDVTMLYMHSKQYMPDYEDSIHPQDPLLKIIWPLTITSLSERDRSKAFIDSSFQGIKE